MRAVVITGAATNPFADEAFTDLSLQPGAGVDWGISEERGIINGAPPMANQCARRPGRGHRPECGEEGSGRADAAEVVGPELRSRPPGRNTA